MDFSDAVSHRYDPYDVDDLMIEAAMHEEDARSFEVGYGSDERGSEEEGSDDGAAEEKGQNTSPVSDRKPDAHVQPPKKSTQCANKLFLYRQQTRRPLPNSAAKSVDLSNKCSSSLVDIPHGWTWFSGSMPGCQLRWRISPAI